MRTKYGWQKQFFALVWRLQGQEHIYIEITPTEVAEPVGAPAQIGSHSVPVAS